MDGIRYLGETLVSKGYITKDQLSKALDICESSGKSLGNVLIEKGYVSESDLSRVLGKEASAKNAQSISSLAITCFSCFC